jgi:FixJ family two-component response regulator
MSEAPLISIIDDDALASDGIRELVESLGYKAVTFSSAEHFLQSSVVTETTCLITDLQMPGLNGLELQEALRSQGHCTPIILITAYPNEKHRNRALDGGAIGFLSKPFDERSLIRCLTAAIKSRSSNAQASMASTTSTMSYRPRQDTVRTTMSDVKWMVKGREFAHCNCAYGCPCQFNALPTHGNCKALVGIIIDSGYHGDTKLDGIKFAGAFSFPGAIHEGHGEAFLVVDESATPAQREAVLRIASGQDTEPGATFFQVFSSMLEKVHDPIFAKVELGVDVNDRKARLSVPGLIEARGETILNPVTKQPHQARVVLPQGFEYTTAEYGRGWGKTFGPIQHDLNDSHAHFCNLHLTGSGVVR